MILSPSPLRYPGGKAKLFPFLARLISRNNLYGVVYREPYAGGAGLALNLLYGGFCSSISLNDSDPAIYCFWHSLLNYNEEFCRRLLSVKITIDEWHRQKEVWSQPDKSNELELGFATYFLNRTNRSGIIEGAGPIGGFSQSGKYKIDARFNLSGQIDIIRQVGLAAELIDISCMDAADYIENNFCKSDLYYLDPPYYMKGRKLYRNFYTHKDHEVIASLVKKMGGNWIVSYDDAPEIRQIYRWQNPWKLSLRYSAGPVGIGREVLYLSRKLKCPDIQNLPGAIELQPESVKETQELTG